MKRTSLAALVAASLAIGLPQAGHAAWPVFDATNYGQNVLQAARAGADQQPDSAAPEPGGHVAEHGKEPSAVTAQLRHFAVPKCDNWNQNIF